MVFGTRRYVIVSDKNHYETAFIIRLLKEFGYEINFQKDKFPYTPLQLAIILGKRHLIHILLECGADPTIVGDDTCEDSLTLAKRLFSGIEHQQQHHHSITEILELFIESNSKGQQVLYSGQNNKYYFL